MNVHSVYRFFSRGFRPRRMRRFQKAFGIRETSQVLDVGGTSFNWHLLSCKPRVTLLNLAVPGEREAGFAYVVADGRSLPFYDGAFAVVFCNSVIEHVGDYEQQQRLAEEIRRVGRSYYVQTPNKCFPIEPHMLAPFLHYFPRSIQRRLLRYCTLRGWILRPTSEEIDRFITSLHLLDEKAFRSLFPDAKIWREKVLGLTKSLIAVKIS